MTGIEADLDYIREVCELEEWVTRVMEANERLGDKGQGALLSQPLGTDGPDKV